jgi:acyl carrier protein
MADEDPDRGSRNIENRLTEFIQNELLAGKVTVKPGDDLLSSGLLDSIAALRLATFVAEDFEFEIQPADFIIENFQTVEALTGYVRRATGQTS